MMWTTRGTGKVGCVGLGAWLLVAVGCAPTVGASKGISSAHTRSAAAAAEEASLPQASLESPDPEDPKAVALSSAIAKVTVYSDRALVTRQASAKLTTEPTVYAFKQLPGWV